MSGKNLWGTLPSAAEIATPTKILKEQAVLLQNGTKGVLKGTVTVSQEAGSFEIELAIVAPLIDYYRYVALVATHSLDMYPVVVAPGWDRDNASEKIDCHTQAQFEDAIAHVLSSERIRRVVASLLAQSRS